MKVDVVYGGIRVPAGSKVSDYIEVYDTGYKFPITIINGKKEGKMVLITSGIHGSEYPSILAAIELAQEIDPEELEGELIIIHPLNITGFYKRVSYILPEDEEKRNLNRLFPGDINGKLGDKIAYFITTEFQDKSYFHIDIHGGDIHETLPPYVYYPGIGDDKKVLSYCEEASQILNVKYRVKSSATTGAYNSAAIRGIPSLLVERGGGGVWTRDEVEKYKVDLKNLLYFIGLLEGEVTLPEQPAKLITRAVYLDADISGLWFPLVELEEEISVGQKIGEIRDVFGKTLREYYANFDAIALFMTTSLAISEGDPIITYGI